MLSSPSQQGNQLIDLDGRALAQCRLTRRWIAKQALPMFCLMIVAVLLIWYFPQIITYLPQQMKMG